MASILETLYPQGDYLNIKANAPTRRDYNIQVNADLARNLPGGLLKDIVAPAAAATLSLPYDAIQAYQRMKPDTGIKGYYDAFMAEDPFSSLGQRFVGASAPLAERLANLNLSKTLSNLVFTQAGAAEVMPENVKNQGLDSFNNLVSDTVMAEPNQFQDYPGVENLGGVQNFDLEGVRDIISQMEEEKGNYIERPEDGFNMNGILQSLGGYAKDAAGRYIGSQALGGAGGILFGPYGALIGGIFGALKGGDLFNQNTYSQQMYNNLTPGGQAYANSLYAPGGLLQGYNQISAFGTGPLGLISKNLSRYGETMSPARRNAYLDAANRIINSQDYSKTGIAAVTKKGTHAYDDSIINYAPPSGGDSGGSGGQTYGSVGSYEDFGTTY